MDVQPLTDEQIWGEPGSPSRLEQSKDENKLCPIKMVQCTYWDGDNCSLEYCVVDK